MYTKEIKSTRFCKKCNQDLPKTLEYFTPRKTDKEGFSLYCKECINNKKREKRKEKRQHWDKGGKVEGKDGRKCTICKNIYPPTSDFFGKHRKSSSGLDTYCTSCRHEKTRQYYYNNKEKMQSQSIAWKKTQRDKINEIKNSCICLKCKENRNWLLDFHHIDPTKKDFQISQGEGYRWEKVQEEIDKCVVLCSNCHRDFHYQEKQIGITIDEYLK